MFFDSHCHINDQHFASDIDGYITRAKEAGVTNLLVIAWDIASSIKAIQIANSYEGVYAAVGIHPVDAVKTPLSDLDILATLLTRPKVVALGEIGLDYHWITDKEGKDIQNTFFIKQIAMANKFKLPIVVHMREATNATFEILKANKVNESGVMHCYSGSAEMAHEFIKLGFYIGIGGPVTYLNAVDPKLVAAAVPADKFLIETDAPYLSPHPFRGKTNESYRIPVIAEAICKIRNLTMEQLAYLTTRNTKRLLKL